MFLWKTLVLFLWVYISGLHAARESADFHPMTLPTRPPFILFLVFTGDEWSSVAGGEPSLSTGGGLPRTGASEYPASSATHLVSSEMGFSIFPWGLNRSLSL